MNQLHFRKSLSTLINIDFILYETAFLLTFCTGANSSLAELCFKPWRVGQDQKIIQHDLRYIPDRQDKNSKRSGSQYEVNIISCSPPG